jgi:hypothetical protein
MVNITSPLGHIKAGRMEKFDAPFQLEDAVC